MNLFSAVKCAGSGGAILMLLACAPKTPTKDMAILVTNSADGTPVSNAKLSLVVPHVLASEEKLEVATTSDGSVVTPGFLTESMIMTVEKDGRAWRALPITHPSRIQCKIMSYEAMLVVPMEINPVLTVQVSCPPEIPR